MKHSRSTFVFKAELGAKLRALRRQRSLSLRDLARQMGRGSPGAFNHLAKLERGDLKYPSANLLLDYLRACGAGAQDVAALFDAYLSQPPVPKQQADSTVAQLLRGLPEPDRSLMLKWEGATVKAREAKAAAEPAKKKPRVETAQQRVFRIVWSFIHATWNEVFEQKLYQAMLRLKGTVPRSERKHACEHGRRFFGVITRYYSNEARRRSALERIGRRAEDDGFSREVVSGLLGAATEAYSELARTGKLDWEPTQEQIIRERGRAPRVLRAEVRLEMDEAGPVNEFYQAYGLVRAMVLTAVTEQLDAAKLDWYYVKKHYYDWLDRLLPIAAGHGAASAEWQAEVDATAPRLHDEAFAREMAALAAKTFEQWKPKLPPRPPNAL